jgi:hypothetical protein
LAAEAKAAKEEAEALAVQLLEANEAQQKAIASERELREAFDEIAGSHACKTRSPGRWVRKRLQTSR